MNESSKAMRRRWREDEAGKFPWRSIFTGRGIDVGCGPDALPFDGCVGFDMHIGDANHLSDYFVEGEFDWLHASQCLEHMHRSAVLLDWMKVVRPGGHLIITVPSWELYEGMKWPSPNNPDHKITWSMKAINSPAPEHVHVPTMLELVRCFSEVVLCRELTANYNFSVGTSVDQTWDEADGVEPWIEICFLRK